MANAPAVDAIPTSYGQFLRGDAEDRAMDAEDRERDAERAQPPKVPRVPDPLPLF